VVCALKHKRDTQHGITVWQQSVHSGLHGRSRSLASVQCCVDTVYKARALEVQWLMEEADGSGVQCACFSSLVGEGRYENDRYLNSTLGQMILQVYAAHFWHLHVQYQTARFLDCC
jgi:hypothetical protein